MANLAEIMKECRTPPRPIFNQQTTECAENIKWLFGLTKRKDMDAQGGGNLQILRPLLGPESSAWTGAKQWVE